MLVRVTLVWRLWQWDATKKTQWESVQACLWFPYKFFFSEFRWKYATIWTALAPNRSCQISLQAPPRPRNSVRCFLTAATLDCFERSKVTLCLSKAKWSPLSALQVSQNTGCIRVEKRDFSPLSTGSNLKFMSDFITDFPRPDKNWQCWKTMFFSLITLQSLNSIFSGNSKH